MPTGLKQAEATLRGFGLIDGGVVLRFTRERNPAQERLADPEAFIRRKPVGLRTTSPGVVRSRHAGGESLNDNAGLASAGGRRGYGRFRRGGVRMEFAVNGTTGIAARSVCRTVLPRGYV